MFKRFYPQLYRQSVYDIDYEALSGQGIRYLIFDLDNTLAPFDVKTPSPEVVSLMQTLENRFSICLLSNNASARVEEFNRTLGLYSVHKAGKPKKGGVLKALALMGGHAEAAALIGDQLFTDIWCANRCGLFSVLVKPLSDRDEWTVRLKRLPEKFVYRRYHRFIERTSNKPK